jgi:hypothetical protein
VESIKPPIQWASEALSREVKRPEREASLSLAITDDII